jgi:hypothetical protein
MFLHGLHYKQNFVFFELCLVYMIERQSNYVMYITKEGKDHINILALTVELLHVIVGKLHVHYF